MAGFSCLACCLAVSGRTRFLDAGYDRVVPVTHMDQAACDELLPPWRNPPQRNLGTAAVSGQRSQDPWLAFPRPIPNWLTRRTTRYNNTGGDGRASTQTHWFKPRPHCWLTCRHQTFTRSSASHRKAVPPSACGNSPAPVCAPVPWLPRCCSFWPSCARRSVWPLRCSGERSSPLR